MAEERSEVFEAEKEVKTDFVKCNGCGANMVFDPQSQMLYCEHCGSKVSFEKDKEVKELAIEKAFSATEKWNDAAVLRCENCGAVVNVSRNEVALSCPYCGTSHVKLTDEISGVKPNALYPFTITADQAELSAKKWAKGRLFAPKKFKKELEAKNLHGVFQPCFTFDSQTQTNYDGRLGKHKTRTVRTKNGTRTETYTVWYNVRGTISRVFDDITISASKTFDKKKMNKIMPFKRESICVYEKQYLAGFSAHHYDKDVRTSWNEAKEEMEQQIRQAIVRKYDCDVVGYLNTSTIHSGVTYKYVLLPIYVLRYHYKKKDYEVDVNGNTGKVVGKAPISALKVLITVLITAVVLFGLWKLFTVVDSNSAQAISDSVVEQLI